MAMLNNQMVYNCPTTASGIIFTQPKKSLESRRLTPQYKVGPKYIYICYIIILYIYIHIIIYSYIELYRIIYIHNNRRRWISTSM